MPKPYSMDLRERATARVAAGEPIRVVATALRISPSCVSKWSGRLQATGSAAPAQIGGYKPRAIAGEQAAWLKQRIVGDDFTLRGLVAELAERGLTVDYRTVWSFVHEEDLSFKKKRAAKRGGSS